MQDSTVDPTVELLCTELIRRSWRVVRGSRPLGIGTVSPHVNAIRKLNTYHISCFMKDFEVEIMIMGRYTKPS